MYALNIDTETGRILSATYAKYAAPNAPIVNVLPDGKLCDYLYVNGSYVFDPLPEPEIPMPEPDPNEIRMQEIEAALIELAAMLGGA